MNKKRVIWEKPWGYQEGILISISLLLLGFILEVATGGRGVLQLLQYPNNIYIGIGVIICIVILSFFRKKIAIVQWLESIPAAISSIGLLLFVSLLMGLTMQYDNNAPDLIRKLGLTHVVSSWPYLFANLFLLISLGLTSLKNIYTFNWNKLGFIISHVGLWLVLFGANFGSVQVQRLQMTIPEGGISNSAFDPSTNLSTTLPFALRLDDFIMEEYNPKLGLVEHSTGNLFNEKGKSTIVTDSGAVGSIKDWKITVLDYIYSSAKAGDSYHFINEMGACPSAYIVATNNSGKTVEGWVCCGSFNKPFESLRLNNDYSLVMLLPEPKEFTSVIDILRKDREPERIYLEVNKPVVIDGWKIYQMSYDSELGRWSDKTVIELITDPWLKLVYFGIFLMLAGALYMFWMGSKNNTNTVKNK